MLIHYAYSTATDAAGNLYFGDPVNYRVRRITFGGTTGIPDVPKSSQNISIYPNPAPDQTTVTTPKKIDSITITNMMGQVVYSQAYSGAEKIEVPVSDFAAGVYFIKVSGVGVWKFVKE